MLKIYFLTRLKNLQNGRIFSRLNIAGFSLGIACILMILFRNGDEHKTDQINCSSSGLYKAFEGQNFDNKVDAFTLLRVCMEIK